ncbi:MAG: filamentous hemagglutinin N-terminal domain-containing protein, partial [Cyanobacteria bacterium P01_D01_bin.2]
MNYISSCYGLALLSGTVGILSGAPSVAQVIPDSTLGAENSIVTPLDAETQRIDGGALRDSTLFHSFEQFGIPENHGVYFANPAAVNTIFSRVTGADPSRLLGTLGVLGAADLVFLNPHGVLFGPNAELDLRGAFTATTASGVTLPGGYGFSAVAPEAVPLLTVNAQAPIGLMFTGEEPGAIANTGSLTVDPDQGIALIGGAVVNQGSLTAPAGPIDLAAVAGEGRVQVGPQSQIVGWERLSGADQPGTGERVYGLAGFENIDPGTVITAGAIDVASPDSAGGTIQILGDYVALLDGRLEASGLTGGGTVLVGGEYRGQGDLPSARQTYIDRGGAIAANAIQSGDGGNVIVWADETTRFHGEISARGGDSFGDGGLVEVSGKENLVFQGFVDAGATSGANGTLLLYPLNIVIVEGAGGEALPNVVENNGERSIVLPWEQDPALDFTIAEETLENIPADVDVTLEAALD